jgi:hypothetical protein
MNSSLFDFNARTFCTMTRDKMFLISGGKVSHYGEEHSQGKTEKG